MPCSTAEHSRRIDDRVQFFVSNLPYLSMAMTLPLVLATASLIGNSRAEVAAIVTLSAATMAWVWWWTTAHPQWRTDELKMTVYYGVRTLSAFVLTWLNPFFGFFAWVGYVDALDYFPPRRAWLPLVATASIIAGSQIGGLPPHGPEEWAIYGVLLVVNLGIVAGMASYEMHRERDNIRRREMIVELEDANARLETALTENAGLQEQLLVQAREAGVDDERQRLAREIHDTIAQGLAGIVTQLQAATEATDTDTAEKHVGRAAALARDSLDDARRSVRNLSPSELEHTALPRALAQLVRVWADGSKVAAELTVTGTEVRLHEEIETTLLRIVQEGLTNVRKHAGAHRVVVTLSYMGDEVSVDVRDDGCGFRHGSANGAGGYGLRAMRERAERIAGRLDVESEPGAGTAVSARVPSVIVDG